MIHDLLLRWIVTGLFVLSAAESGLAIITERRPWTLILSRGLHFIMAVAMALMAWPWSMQFPTRGPAVFFLLAALVFVAMAVFAARTTALRGVHGYHGLMMLATAWMYAIMDGHLLAVRSSTGSPIWFSAVNWFGTVGFAVATVCWTYRRSPGDLSQAMMAAGMSIFFLATLFRI
ncbi:DUF5134 domain-containing protein [Mycobacterium sp.]|uniref:DUF5134 domain-containing protein n=1 Tax=Mycobacterium sp. TaxID=1785 RepID=UPI003D6BE0E4